MAKTGDAEELWWVLQVCNPVGLAHVVPHAAPRQSKGPERNLVEIEL